MNAPARLVDRPERLRLSVEDFILLHESGSFDDYGKTELIDGEIWFMNAQWSRHARAKSRLLVSLALRLKAIGSDLEAISEVSVRVAGDSLPEPDIVLTHFQGDHEMPAESLALIVEVAGTTLTTDLGRKAELYAAAGLPEYWVIDLDGGTVIVHHQPAADGYGRRKDVPLGDLLVSETIDGLTIDSSGLVA